MTGDRTTKALIIAWAVVSLVMIFVGCGGRMARAQGEKAEADAAELVGQRETALDRRRQPDYQPINVGHKQDIEPLLTADWTCGIITQYWMDHTGTVRMHGPVVYNGSVTDTSLAFTLPTGFTPGIVSMYLPITSFLGGVFGTATAWIESNGKVHIVDAVPDTYYYIEAISFVAER